MAGCPILRLRKIQKFLKPLSDTECKGLLKKKYIEIAAIIDPMKLGNGIEGTIRIKADIKQMEQVTKALKLIPELFYVARVSGKTDFDTSFFVKNMNEARILIDRINLIEGVIDTDMATVLEYVKERYDYEWG